jgi:hypothetical protein
MITKNYTSILVSFFFISILLFSCKPKNTALDVLPAAKKDTLTNPHPPDTMGGIYREYYPTGIVKLQGVYKNKMRDADWSYFYENGKLWSTGLYENGKRNGYSYVYFSSGIMQMEGNYIDDQPVGVWKFYNEKGDKIHEEIKK